MGSLVQASAHPFPVHWPSTILMGCVHSCLNYPYPVPCQAESLVPGNVVVDGVVVAVVVSCRECCSSSTFDVALHTRDAPLETDEAYIKLKKKNTSSIIVTLKFPIFVIWFRQI